MNSTDIAAIRQEYVLASLNEEETFDDPILQFQKWFQEAVNAEIDDVNAFSLATVDATGKPHNRIVLLKGLEDEQFVFFTNYHSHKGREIEMNPHVALNFYWVELQRQVRIEGQAQKISHHASEAYFHSRPVESQLGAWASHQSDVLKHRTDLDRRFEELKQKYEGQKVPCPPHWGGYAITAHRVEFWQGRMSRMHDRIAYERRADQSWSRCRLNP
jgi:pyridoxamine 5'-phosphate oxidase